MISDHAKVYRVINALIAHCDRGENTQYMPCSCWMPYDLAIRRTIYVKYRLQSSINDFFLKIFIANYYTYKLTGKTGKDKSDSF